MKKILIYAAVFAVMMLMTTASYADVEYTVNDSSVVYSKVGGKKTVIIFKNDGDAVKAEDVIYVDQTDDTPFAAGVKFFVKQNPADGRYTIKMYDGTQTSSSNFYIGMSQFAGDVKMTRREVQDDGETPETENVRYLCSVSGNRSFKNVIMKINGYNYAFPLGDGWSASGGVVLGIEIVGVDAQNVTEVWLSERTFDKTNSELKNQEASAS